MAGSTNSIVARNVLRGRLSEDNLMAGAVGTAYNPTYAIVTEAGAQIVLYINSSNYQFYAELKDKYGNHISNSNIIDLPLESMVVDGSYDAETKEVVLVLDNGNEVRFSVADLVEGLVSTEQLNTILNGYVQFTDYATVAKAGAIKISDTYATAAASGALTSQIKSYEQYNSLNNNAFVSKGTLENVITGKELTNKEYVDTADEVFENDLFGDKTVNDNGENIILDNTTQAPMKIELKGNTYQFTTTGANILNPSYATTNCTVSGNDITITGSGTDMYLAGGYSATLTTLFTVPAGTYYALCTNSKAYISVYGIYDGETTIRGISSNGVTFNQTFYAKGIRIRSTDGTTNLQNEVVNLYLGTPNSYEPYTGGIASPNPSYPQDIQVVSGDNTIKVEGKNLIDCVIVNDTSSEISPTKTVDVPLKAGTYTVRFIGKVYGEQISSGLMSGSTYIATLNWYDVSKTFTLTEDTTITKVFTQVPANKTFYVQLEKGNTASETYTPYVSQTYPISLGDIELCKIGTYQDKIAKSTGKNLFDKDSIEQTSYYIDPANGNHTTQSGSIIYKFEVMPNTSYVRNNIKNSSNVTFFSSITYWDKNNNYISGSWNGNQVITTPNNENIKYMIWSTSADMTQYSDTQTYLDNFMIEKGNQATSYEPYGTSWYLNKQIGKVVFDGSENWAKYGAYGNGYLFYLDNVIFGLISSTYPYGNGLSDKFIWIQNSTPSDVAPYVRFNGSGNRLYIAMTSDMTLENFKTWLSTHNTEVYYLLRTPIYTEITNSTLLSQLEDLEKAKSYNEQTNLNQDNNDMPFEIAAIAFVDSTAGKLAATAAQIDTLNEVDDNLSANKEDKSNKVATISASSTDIEYPTAKCVYDIIGDVESLLEALDIGSGV